MWKLNFELACSGVFYPGTGGADEVGYLQGQGYSVNVPWPHGGMGNGACIQCLFLLPLVCDLRSFQAG